MRLRNLARGDSSFAPLIEPYRHINVKHWLDALFVKDSFLRQYPEAADEERRRKRDALAELDSKHDDYTIVSSCLGE